jgi:ABC-type nitrate/sulfonate/bicarbonate transport system substrate-binding protein
MRSAMVAALATFGIGCAMLPGPARAAEPIKVVIGYQSLWAGGGEVVEVLRHTNIFELNGIAAEYKTFTFGGPLAEAALAGDIDNVFAADAPVLRAMADFQGGLADLKGKKLSAPFATTTFPRSMKAIEAAGIKQPLQEMTIINQDIAEQTNAMQGHLVDAVTTWDPTMERLVQQKLAKVIWSAPRGENIGMQGFSGKWLQANGNEGAVKFLKAWIMATWWASNHIDQAHEWFAKTSRLPIDLLKVATDFDRNLGAPIADINKVDLTLSDADIASSQDVMTFLYDNKLLNTKIEVKPYFDMGPLNEAAAEIRSGKSPDLKAIKVVAE